jgi:hypothetical protein
MTDHCWHEYENIKDTARRNLRYVCCHCGYVYSPFQRIPKPGHGLYSPDLITTERPKGPCPKRKPNAD